MKMPLESSTRTEKNAHNWAKTMAYLAFYLDFILLVVLVAVVAAAAVVLVSVSL